MITFIARIRHHATTRCGTLALVALLGLWTPGHAPGTAAGQSIGPTSGPMVAPIRCIRGGC